MKHCPILFAWMFCALLSPAAPEDDPQVAKVLGESITEKQILKMIDEMARLQQIPPQQLDQKEILFFKPALDRLINQVLLRQEAGRKGITISSDQVEKTYQEVVARFPSETAFRERLTEQRVTEEELRKSIEDNLTYQGVLDLVLRELSQPTDEQIRKFYEDNQRIFQIPEEVHAAHILLRTKSDSTAEQKAAIRNRLGEIRDEIESGRTPFDQAAAKYSEDQTNAQSGGDLGFFPRGRMVAPFEEAAFSAGVGTVTPALETPFGYHLIKVLGHKPASRISLEEAKEGIRNLLQGQAQQAAISRYLEDLREQAQVETVMSEEVWKQRRSEIRGQAP